MRPGFRQVRAGLRHAFDFFVENLVANLLHQSRHVEVEAASSLVRPRARQMECRKKPILNKFAAGFRHAVDSTCLRPACNTLRQVCDQVCSWLECGLNPLIGTLKPQSNGPLHSDWLTDGLLHLVQLGDWADCGLAVPNVRAHPPTASVPTS